MKSPLPDHPFISLLLANQNRSFGLFPSVAPSLTKDEDWFRQACMTPRDIREKHEPAIQTAAPLERTFLLTK